MLFNSFEFALLFMPCVLAGFLLLSRISNGLAACGCLALASLFFYGYWAPEYLYLLLISIAANYGFGRAILQTRRIEGGGVAKRWLVLAIALNLSALAYFKYANFLVDNINFALGSGFEMAHVVLPIGISFFTFTQIAYLIDTYQGKVKETNPVHYLLFVTYFPHLIAGPILHHAEMMPQFRDRSNFSFRRENFLCGLVVFLIGLFKKVILADGIQPYVAPVFDAPLGQSLTPLEAWGGALAYTLQLYFDFSGYSDMAIGLSRMFNIELPLNFNSPYKATNISDFWRRWHMTLSRFLRDYLYIPLGGNRSGSIQRYTNLMITMLLGGLWHGAGWTFVIWGGLHGFYLVCNHAWQAAHRKVEWPTWLPAWLSHMSATLLTFLCVVVAWVFFRAQDFPHAMRVLTAMADFQSFALPLESHFSTWLQTYHPELPLAPLDAYGGDRQLVWTACLLGAVWLLPNTQEAIAKIRAGNWWRLGSFSEFSWFGVGAIAFWTLLILIINETRGVSEFIYFNF